MGTTVGYLFSNALSFGLNSQFDWDTDTIKCMLTTSSYSPNQDTHDYVNDVTNECTGTGYTAGGATLGSCARSLVLAASANAWQASTAYLVGDVVRKVSTNGHVYVCMTAGTSHSSEPTWPTTAGDKVTETGGVVWMEAGRAYIMLDAADASWTSATIANARRAVIYRDTGNTATSPLIGWHTFDADTSVSDGTLSLTWRAAGVFQLFIQ